MDINGNLVRWTGGTRTIRARVGGEGSKVGEEREDTCQSRVRRKRRHQLELEWEESERMNC